MTYPLSSCKGTKMVKNTIPVYNSRDIEEQRAGVLSVLVLRPTLFISSVELLHYIEINARLELVWVRE